MPPHALRAVVATTFLLAQTGDHTAVATGMPVPGVGAAALLADGQVVLTFEGISLLEGKVLWPIDGSEPTGIHAAPHGDLFVVQHPVSLSAFSARRELWRQPQAEYATVLVMAVTASTTVVADGTQLAVLELTSGMRLWSVPAKSYDLAVQGFKSTIFIAETDQLTARNERDDPFGGGPAGVSGPFRTWR